MNSKIIIFFGAIVLAVADDRPTYSYGQPEPRQFSAESGEPKFDFNYVVKDEDSGADFGHQESRVGDNTQGFFYVHLPDSRLQKVAYYVEGDSGFEADVSFEGEAQYPESVESREYSPPKQYY